MLIDDEEEKVETTDEDAVVKALLLQNKKEASSNTKAQKMLSNTLDALAVAITELANNEKTIDTTLWESVSKLLEKTIAESITPIAKILSEPSDDKEMIKAIQAISDKSSKDTAALVLALSDQNKALIETVKGLKGDDRYSEVVEKIVSIANKSNELISKGMKVPDYSKEFKSLTEAVKRPEAWKHEVFYHQNGKVNYIVSKVGTK